MSNFMNVEKMFAKENVWRTSTNSLEVHKWLQFKNVRCLIEETILFDQNFLKLQAVKQSAYKRKSQTAKMIDSKIPLSIGH
jgi:hypothetical protein